MAEKKLSKYSTITEAIASGDILEMYKAQADDIAKALDATESVRDKAQLHNKLHQIVRTLREMEPPKTESKAARLKKESAAQKDADKD